MNAKWLLLVPVAGLAGWVALGFHSTKYEAERVQQTIRQLNAARRPTP